MNVRTAVNRVRLRWVVSPPTEVRNLSRESSRSADDLLPGVDALVAVLSPRCRHGIKPLMMCIPCGEDAVGEALMARLQELGIEPKR